MNLSPFSAKPLRVTVAGCTRGGLDLTGVFLKSRTVRSRFFE
jgi:hypothetical protein